MKAVDLKAFNPDDFKTHEDAFQNLFSKTASVTKKFSLLYIFLPAVATVTFANDFE